jgi:tetratricopeptide (TPR) repeat protein
MSPASFHAVNIILHGMVTALVVWWLFLLTSNQLAALCAGAIFAVLPVHVEAVAGVVNRAELLAGLFTLAACIYWLRFLDYGGLGRASLVALCFGLGLLSKEHVATFPIIAAILYAHRRKARTPETDPSPRVLLGIFAVLAMILLVYFYQRASVLPSAFLGSIPLSDNPLVEADISGRLRGVLSIFYHYVRVTLVPLTLSVDYSAHALAMPPSWASNEVVIGAVAIAFSLWSLVWSLRRQQWDLAVCLAMFAVLYGLLSNIMFLNTIIFAERLMYLPSVAVCGVLGLVMAKAIVRSSRLQMRVMLFAAVCIIITGFATRSWSRAHDWRDQYTLFSRAVESFPNSARARHNYGSAAMNRGLIDVAEVQFKAALRIDPTDAASVSALGEVAFSNGRYSLAEQRLSRAMEMRPSKKTLARLCPAAFANRNLVRAVDVCRLAHAKMQNDEAVHVYLVLALEQIGDIKNAQYAAKSLQEKGTRHPLGQAAIERLLGGQ